MSPLDVAQAHLKRAIELDPDYPDPYYHLALQLIEQNRLPAAEWHLQRAVELASRSAEAFEEREKELITANQFGAAKRYGFKSHERRLFSARACYHLGLVLREIGDKSAAAKQFTQATALDPTLAKAYYQLGCAALEQQQAARSFFEQAVKADFTLARAHYELARLITAPDENEIARNHYLIALDLEAGMQNQALDKRFGG